jgi:hypothetical protein
MGLDQYLYVREYISGYNFQKESNDSISKQEYEKFQAIVKDLDAGLLIAKDSPHAYVELCTMYWRKANAIHGWIVKNCADGVDECQPIYLSRDQLATLQDLAARAIEGDKEAQEELSPTEGFFFGGTDRDEWYYLDLKTTRDGLAQVLKVAKDKPVSFTYMASW